MHQPSGWALLRFAAIVAIAAIILSTIDPDPTTPRIAIYAVAAITAALAPQWLPRITHNTRR